MLQSFSDPRLTFYGSDLTKSQYTFAKSKNYVADGSGRDAYINTNSGGFVSPCPK